MVRRAILQIGTEKTGTTTLQHFLAANRDRLARAGYRYPRFCGDRNHTGLAAFALDASKTDPIRAPFGYAAPADLVPMQARLRAAAKAELRDGATAIFCSEHCHSRLTLPSEIAALRDFLAEHFDLVQVCVYLRRQDQIALSLFSTSLKSGGVSDRILPAINAGSLYYNYDLFLAQWEAAFGAENMHVRLADRAEMTGGGVVPDFLSYWRIGAPEDFIAVADQNASMLPCAQEFLRLVNAHFEESGAVPGDAVRGPLVARLEKGFRGAGARPARAEAEAFYAAFQASNDAVRARHFPDRATLFNEDFSGYPDVADARDLAPAAVAAVAARMLVATQEEICRLEAEVAVRDARLHWSQERRPAAIAALRRALGWRPTHAEAHRTLGEYLLRDDKLVLAVASARAAVEHKPENAEYRHFLGMVLRKSGAFDEALAAQDLAIALQPDFDGAVRERDQLLLTIMKQRQNIA